MKRFISLILLLTLTLSLIPFSDFDFIAKADNNSAPLLDSKTDIGKYVNFYQSTDLLNEYDNTGTIKLTSGTATTYGDNYTPDGTYYASVKMSFDEYFEWAFVKNEETGKWERGAGNSGIVWGQTGLKIGTYTKDDGRTVDVTLAYRRGQKGFFIMDPGGTAIIATGVQLNGGGQYDEVVLTAKYDSKNKLITVWLKGDDNNAVVSNEIDMSAVKDFAFTGFDLRCGNGGSHPEDLNDITNENMVKNHVIFSDFHIWGDVLTTKHYKAPGLENNTNIADELTLSNQTLNADWKDDGSFTWDFSTAIFNGIEFKQGTKVYARVTLTNIAKSTSENTSELNRDIYGVAFANDGTNYSLNYLRSQWNQQGVFLGTGVSLISTGGMGNAGTNGSIAGWDGANEQIFIYEYDVDANTVDVWRRTSVYEAYWQDIYQAHYQDVYIGKYDLGSNDMVLGLTVGPYTTISNFDKPVTVSNVQVWTEVSSASVNKIENIAGVEGGFFDDNLKYNDKTNNLTTPATFKLGGTTNTTGVFKALKVGGYSGKTTVVWQGLTADLSKGGIVYEADLTLFANTQKWQSVHNGFIVGKIDGQYVMVGLGNHSDVGNTYKPTTRINGGDEDQASATTLFLGANATLSSNTVEASAEGTKVNLKVVLTDSSITSYVNGVVAQTFNISGKTVEPVFAWGWGSGNKNDCLTNVKIYGDGVEVCEHSYKYICSEKCDICGMNREVTDDIHSYDSKFDTDCDACGKNDRMVASIKILSIGHSYAWNSIEYLRDIAKSQGVDLTVGLIYRGNCSLQIHLNNFNNNIAYGDDIGGFYLKYDSENPAGTYSYDTHTIADAVTEENWDYIMFQECLNYAGFYDVISASLPELKQKVSQLATNPNVKYMWHKIWALEKPEYMHLPSDANFFTLYNNDQQTMYEAIKAASLQVKNSDIGIHDIVHTGEAFQLARKSGKYDPTVEGGVTLNADHVSHANDYGKYLASLVWYMSFTGCSIDKDKVMIPECISKEMAMELIDFATEAVTTNGKDLGSLEDVFGETSIVNVTVGDIEIEMTTDEKLPINERIDTKYVLGWKNPDGTKYNGLYYASGIVAEFVETKMMNVKYQLGKNGDSIRYIASVDDTKRYKSVGWLFSLENANPEKGGVNVTDKSSTKVYTGILANGVVKTTTDVYGDVDYAKYFYVYEIIDIPESESDTVIHVRPYVEMEDGRIVYGDVSEQTLNNLKNLNK